MMDFVRDGDTVVVESFSRLARSSSDLAYLVKWFGEQNIALKSDKENFDTSTAVGKLMVAMLASIAEFERDIMLERQAEGIAQAKLRGVYKGRKPKPPITEADYLRWKTRTVTKVALAKELQCDRRTLDRLIRDFETSNATNLDTSSVSARTGDYSLVI
jgi:DNA invertase Pin-like site-specific DNA recombinase